MRLAAPLVALIVAAFTLPSFAQESSREDFEEFCKAWEGRWVSESKLKENAPGVGEKGDKVTVYADCKILADGKAMVCTIYSGAGNGILMVAFNPHEMRIKTMFAGADGGQSNGIMFKEDGLWIQESTGSTQDGEELTARYTVTITNQGETHTWTGRAEVGGEQLPESVDVYHRVAK